MSSARSGWDGFPMNAVAQRARQAGYVAGVVAPLALAASQMWSAHEETERARIEADRAESCETDYREAMADLWRKIEDLRGGR